jgi:hypothetical protein
MNRLTKDPFIILCLGVALYFGVEFISKLMEDDPAPILQEAQMSYSAGEKTTDVTERKKAFNQSLKLLLGLEEQYAPTFGNGKLYYDMGNNFFQLEEYPQALLYYYRAEQLRPRDDRVQSHIALTQKKIGITPALVPHAFDWLIFFHNDFSLPERLQLFFALGLLSLALISCYLWIPKPWIYALALASVIATVPMLLSLCYTYSFAPIQAVIVQSSLIYRDAGLNYATVKSEPLQAGVKVKVLGVTTAGKWLKIATEDGTMGYIPQEALRTI